MTTRNKTSLDYKLENVKRNSKPRSGLSKERLTMNKPLESAIKRSDRHVFKTGLETNVPVFEEKSGNENEVKDCPSLNSGKTQSASLQRRSSDAKVMKKEHRSYIPKPGSLRQLSPRVSEMSDTSSKANRFKERRSSRIPTLKSSTSLKAADANDGASGISAMKPTEFSTVKTQSSKDHEEYEILIDIHIPDDLYEEEAKEITENYPTGANCSEASKIFAEDFFTGDRQRKMADEISDILNETFLLTEDREKLLRHATGELPDFSSLGSLESDEEKDIESLLLEEKAVLDAIEQTEIAQSGVELRFQSRSSLSTELDSELSLDTDLEKKDIESLLLEENTILPAVGQKEIHQSEDVLRSQSRTSLSTQIETDLTPELEPSEQGKTCESNMQLKISEQIGQLRFSSHRTSKFALLRSMLGEGNLNRISGAVSNVLNRVRIPNWITLGTRCTQNLIQKCNMMQRSLGAVTVFFFFSCFDPYGESVQFSFSLRDQV